VTVADLHADLCADLGFGAVATAPSDLLARLLRHYNKAQRAILREPGLSRLRDTAAPMTFASVVDQAIYGLPSQLERITAITERDSDRVLMPLALRDLRSMDPALRASGGPPSHFVPLGYRPVKHTIDSTGLWVASSSASDTTQTARIQGIKATGEPTGPLTASLNGVTRVQIASSITNFADVQEFTISAVGVGTISLYDAASSGNTLAEIPIGKQSSQYFVIQLYPTPGSAITYYVDGTLKIPELVNTQDVPIGPDSFHDLIGVWARMHEYEIKGDQERFVIAQAEYAKGLSRLKYSVANHAAEAPVLGGRASRHQSRYGAWAPIQPWE